MLDDAKGGPVTLKTLAKTYIRRKKEHKETGGPPLGLHLWFVNLLITVLHGGEIPGLHLEEPGDQDAARAGVEGDGAFVAYQFWVNPLTLASRSLST
jgi:hypothetical protein